MKNKHIFIPLFVFLGAGLISLIYSIIDYKAINPALAYSSETIQFDYDGASDGLDPDGNLFNAKAFLTDDVIENALNKSEINKTVDEVRPYIAIENVVPKNIMDQLTTYESILVDTDNDGGRNITSKDYHPVRYSFVVYQDLGVSKGKLNSLVENLVDEYIASFHETYQKSFKQDVYNELFNIDSYDYTYQSQIYVARLRVLMNYASNLYNEHPEYIVVDENNPELVNGKTFNDLILKAQQLIGTDSSKINNIIILNALSKDVDRLKDYYTYLLQNLNYDKVKYTADYDAITSQIVGDPTDPNDDYKINPTVYVGTGENIIQVQDDTAATYNNLLNQQISLANTLTAIDKQIADYQDILDKLNAAIASGDAETTVQRLITKLGQDYQDLDALFDVMVDAYNNKYVKEGVVSKGTVRHNSASIVSGSFIVHTVKVAAPIMLTVMFGISIFYLVWVIRKEKEKKTA